MRKVKLFSLFFLVLGGSIPITANASSGTNHKMHVAQKKENVSPLKTLVFITPSILYRLSPIGAHKYLYFDHTSFTANLVILPTAKRGRNWNGTEIHHPIPLIS